MEGPIVTVSGIDAKGRAYAFHNGKKIFVKYGVPKDIVRIRVYKVGRGRRGRRVEFWADITEVLKPSELRVEPKCKHFGVCGGCRFQNMDYNAQLEFKKDVSRKFFHDIYKLPVNFGEVIPSPKIYFYRNRMDYPVGLVDGNPAVGLKMAGRWDVLVPLDECFLLSEKAVEIIHIVRDFMMEKDIEAYDIFRHEGLVRYVVIREGKFTGDRLISIVTSDNPFPYLDELVSELKNYATGIIWSINPTLTDISIGREIRPLYGKDYLEEDIRGVKYHIHPNAFFQTNSYQTVNMVEIVREMASGGGLLMDLYSGVGLFSLQLRDLYNDVLAVEVDEYSTYSAEINIGRVDGNITIYKGRVEDVLPLYVDSKPDTVIVDPPRPGLSRSVKQDLLRLLPNEIIYVSCNPETIARDIKYLSKEYKVEGDVKLIDMFPHTPHIELIAKLVRRNN